MNAVAATHTVSSRESIISPLAQPAAIAVLIAGPFRNHRSTKISSHSRKTATACASDANNPHGPHRQAPRTTTPPIR